MIAIPFIYFTLLTAYWWYKHQGFDVCVYMSALYALTSFCGVCVVAGGLLDANGILFDEYNLELGIVPTFLYCSLITLGIYPFSLIYRKDMEKPKEFNSLGLDIFCWILIVVSLINIYLVYDSTGEVLSGDLSTVRMDHYEGFKSPAQLKAATLPRIFGYIFYFKSATILALPLFFFYVSCTSKPWWFNALLMLTSLTMPINCMQLADRTEFTFYGLMFAFCLVFFWKFLSKRFKWGLAFAGTPFMLAVLAYLAAVSQARFAQNDDNEKAYEAALQYAGQNYLNFCYFWEHAKTQYVAPEREFPFTYHTLFKIDSNPERRDERSGQQGFWMSVFATYAGDVLLDLTPIGAILWCFALFLISLIIIRYSHRRIYDAGDILAIFFLAAIPIFGIFYYRYYSFDYIYELLPVIAVYILMKNKIVYE